MSILRGIYITVLHPRLVIISIIMNVLLTIITALGANFGFKIVLLSTFVNESIQFNGVFPFWIPLLDDINIPYYYLEANNKTWLLGLIFSLVLMVAQSLAIAMFLGSIKCFIVGADNTYSILKLGKYYFKKLFIFIISIYLFTIIFYFLELSFWPVGLLLFVIFSLVPYVLILKDVSIVESLKLSLILFIKNFPVLVLLALICFILTMIITSFSFTNKYINYIYFLLSYSFIGTAFIFSVMERLYLSIHRCKPLPLRIVKKSKLYYPLLLLAVVLLLLFGSWLANFQLLAL